MVSTRMSGGRWMNFRSWWQSDGNDLYRKVVPALATRGLRGVTAVKRRLYLSAVRNTPYPVQVVWGIGDRALTWRRYGVQAQMAAGLDHAVLLRGKHFVQEDCPQEIADAVHRLACRAATEN